MIGKLRRTHGDEHGFTLVELLIVVTILGILAAIVTTSLVGLTATAKTNACAEELRTVQTAMDALMAKNNITAVTAQAAPGTTLMTTVIGGGEALSPGYIRQSNTKGGYFWTAAGAVSASASVGSCF